MAGSFLVGSQKVRRRGARLKAFKISGLKYQAGPGDRALLCPATHQINLFFSLCPAASSLPRTQEPARNASALPRAEVEDPQPAGATPVEPQPKDGGLHS